MSKSENLPTRGLILIVEDNKTTQHILLQMAALIGVDAETADNGYEALAKLSVKKFNVIIMDNEMPQLNGYETTKLLRGAEGLNRKTPIISITAKLTNASYQKYKEAGINEFLTKPFSILDLQRSIGRWLNAGFEKKTAAEVFEADSEAGEFQTNPDLQRLERLAGRNPAGFRRFVDTFLRDTSAALNLLFDALSANNFEESYRCAHSCLGASSFCGFTALTTHLQELESAIAEKDLRQSHLVYENVCKEFLKVEHQLAMIH